MPDQPKRYTVQDTRSGKTVTFEWSGAKAPTDSDFESVFKSAGLRSDATSTNVANPNPQPEQRTLGSVLTDVLRPALYTNPVNVASTPAPIMAKDVSTALNVGLPLLAAPLPPVARTVATGGLAGTAAMLGKSIEGAASGQPAPVGDLFKTGLQNSLLGAGIQGAAEGVGAAAKIGAPFASRFDKPTADLATQYGVKLPASSLSNSRAVPLIESLAAKGLFSDYLGQTIDRAAARLNQIADSQVASFGKSTVPMEVGNSVASGMKRYEDAFRSMKSELYDKASIKGAGITVEPTRTLQALDGILGDMNNIVGKKPGILGQLQALRDGLDPNAGLISSLRAKGMPDNVIQKVVSQQGAQNGLTAEKALATLRDLNTKVNFKNPNPIVQGYEGQIRKVAAALNEDLDASIAAQRPDIGAAINQANDFYKAGVQRLNSAWGKKINQFIEQGKTSEIAPALLNRSTPVEQIPQIFEVVGEDGTKALQAATLDHIFDKARGASGNFTQYGLTKQMNTFGPEKLQAIFGPEKYQTLVDISKMTQALNKGEFARQGSQTGFLIRLLGELGKITTKPFEAVRMLIGDAAYSKFLSSDVGQKWLTTGFYTPSNAVAPAVGTAVRVGAEANQSPQNP